MKTKVKAGILLALVFTVALLVALLSSWQVKSNGAFAEEAENATQSTGEFVIFDEENVDAAFTFIKLTDTECSVRVANKSEATKAIVPSFGTIDGKKYRVTEIAGSGFSSAQNLVRVSLPNSVKKINSNAFANSPSMEYKKCKSRRYI